MDAAPSNVLCEPPVPLFGVGRGSLQEGQSLLS